jgi:uncharacterized protein (DUF2267 family)
MELLSRLGEPVLERLRALPAQRRLAGIALGLLVGVGLWLLVGRSLPVDFVPLLDGREFSEPQIARISSAFRKHRLEGAKISGRSIEIPRNEKSVYLMALDAENAWPAEFDAPVERALADTNPLMPWQQSRENLQRGEKQMLARIVAEMNGIENAAVQYDEVRHPGFPPRIESRAVVAVKAVGLRHLEPEEVEAIRDTVVAFKSGLEREQVTITDLNACRAYPGSRVPDTSYTAARALTAAKRAIEEQWQAKIVERLRMYPDLTVAVNAHFDETPPAERLELPSESSPPVSMRLVQVTASIDVPRSYFVDVWRQRYGAPDSQPPGPEQIQEIEQEICGTIARAVSAMLPPPAQGWQTPHQVTVTSHDELQADPGRFASIARWTAWGWPVSVGASSVFALAIAAVWYFRRRSRTKSDSKPGFAAPLPDRIGPRPLSVVGGESPPAYVELQQQLTALVLRDPAAAAEVLKQWLGRAA